MLPLNFFLQGDLVTGKWLIIVKGGEGYKLLHLLWSQLSLAKQKIGIKYIITNITDCCKAGALCWYVSDSSCFCIFQISYIEHIPLIIR